MAKLNDHQIHLLHDSLITRGRTLRITEKGEVHSLLLRPRKIRQSESPEMAATMKAKWQDPEYRAKMEAYRQRQRENPKPYFRRGIPDGMTKKEANEMFLEARLKAKEDILNMKVNGDLEIDPRAEEALETAITIMRSKMNQRDQLAAARLVLEYTKAKPQAKSEVTVKGTEDWIFQITNGATEED